MLGDPLHLAPLPAIAALHFARRHVTALTRNGENHAPFPGLSNRMSRCRREPMRREARGDDGRRTALCALPQLQLEAEIDTRLRDRSTFDQVDEHLGRLLADLETWRCDGRERGDRKSTRLNSSHGYISYAVFCLKKKK